MLIFLYPKGGETEEVEEDLDKTEFYVLATLNTHKVLEEDLNIKTCILTRKRSQGIAIANII
jgi:hypothetical protein